MGEKYGRMDAGGILFQLSRFAVKFMIITKYLLHIWGINHGLYNPPLLVLPCLEA